MVWWETPALAASAECRLLGRSRPLQRPRCSSFWRVAEQATRDTHRQHQLLRWKRCWHPYAKSEKTLWVERLPKGKPAKDSLARLIEMDQDEAEESHCEAVHRLSLSCKVGPLSGVVLVCEVGGIFEAA